MVQGASVPRGVRIGLVLSITLVLLSLAGLLALRLGSAAGRAGLPVFGPIPQFELVDQEGRPFTNADLEDEILLVGFIYTSCPDICPATTAQMRSLQQTLAREGLADQVELLSITVDPEFDTPERLRAYAQVYEADTANWRFLTGRPNHVRAVVEKGFLVGMEQVPAEGSIHAAHGQHEGHGGTAEPDYRVEHGGRVALVDRKGQIRAYHDGTQLDQALILEQIRSLSTGR